MSLKAESEMAGKIVRCPGCNIKLQIPANIVPPHIPPPDIASSPSYQDRIGESEEGAGGAPMQPQRTGWHEQDPTNPNALISFSIGLVITLGWFGIIYPFQAAPGKPVADFTGAEFLANVFYKHFTVSFANTLFFCWAMAICYLKLQKLRHQREALFLDVLPVEIGKEINAQNVGSFIDHVYDLPRRLRDSLMVNRIRKALEFFEVRQNVSDVSAMMTSQSAIDGSRISGSYIVIRAFLWAIPLLGFIGTVVGLSHAIGGMSFANVEDVSKIVGSINNVTSGLGTAFDATLLGLVLAVILNFPLNSLAKHEDEMLNDIDAFCNEVLLPRLNDGAGAGGGNIGAVADSVVKALSAAQKEFLVDLNELSKRMNDYASNLDRRMDSHQQTVTKEFVTNMTAMRTEVQLALKESMRLTSQYIAGLDTGIRGLNTVLRELGEKQVVVQQVKKKGWFSRG
jgi:flagellar motor component MotA